MVQALRSKDDVDSMPGPPIDGRILLYESSQCEFLFSGNLWGDLQVLFKLHMPFGRRYKESIDVSKFDGRYLDRRSDRAVLFPSTLDLIGVCFEACIGGKAIERESLRSNLNQLLLVLSEKL